MSARRRLYAAHRWVGLIVGLQLLAWSAGGMVFALLDFDDVVGRVDRAEQQPATLPTEGLIDPATILAQLDGGPASKLELRLRAGDPVYVVEGRTGRQVYDARTGEPAPNLDAKRASRIARNDFAGDAPVRSIQLIESNPPIEYRGKPLPAFQVVLEHEKDPHIYVSAVTGDVTARRNAPWRLFDFFFMLHVMDYSGREDHNHALLQAMSVLAVVSSLTGLSLWGWRFRRGWRKRRARAS